MLKQLRTANMEVRKMNEEVKELKGRAELAKVKLLYGEISYEEARLMVKPYVDLFNEKSKEIAKKYNVRPKMTSVSNFLR